MRKIKTWFQPLFDICSCQPHIISNKYKVEDTSVMTANSWFLPSKDKSLTTYTSKQASNNCLQEAYLKNEHMDKDMQVKVFSKM